jgi:hypothetical protein
MYTHVRVYLQVLNYMAVKSRDVCHKNNFIINILHSKAPGIIQISIQKFPMEFES